MIGRNEKRRHRLSGAIVTMPEKLLQAYCGDGPHCPLLGCMAEKEGDLERSTPQDDQATLGVFEVSGSIKWFDPSKGYGFIVPDRGLPDVLLHVSCLRRAGFQTACEGARVVCEAAKSAKGLHVVRILVVDESTAIHPSQLPQRTMSWLPLKATGNEPARSGSIGYADLAFSPVVLRRRIFSYIWRLYGDPALRS